MVDQAGPARPSVSAERGSAFSTVRNLWPYMWPHDRRDLQLRVAWAAAALVAAKVITVLVPYGFKWATDALVGPEIDPGTVFLFAVPVLLVIAYGVGRILANGFNQLRDALFAKVSQHAVRRLVYRTFTHLHQLSLRFHLQRRTGGVARTLERGMSGIDTIVRFAILNAVPTIFEFVLTAIVITVHFDWFYLLVIAITVWIYVWYSVRASDKRIHIRRRMNNSDTDANSKAVDSLLNYETVKYFGNEELETRRFDESMEKYEKAAVETWVSLAHLNNWQTVIFSIGMITCMVLSARGVMNGTQTIGDFVMINALLMQLAIPLNFIGFLYREIRQGFADIEQLFDLLDQNAEIKDAPDARPLAVTGPSIVFEDVAFHYDEDRPILRGISFEVPAGRTIAIVGPSGAGKSTISRLLFRFYDVIGGAIRIDGQDIRDVTQASLRAAIGMVPQDTVLFNDTIGYNIRYGRPSATDEEVWAAAHAAQIGGLIEALPKGLDTEVGERGLKLSGGEKQRVAIARTILKAPAILILDEATSALDTNTEREIQAALDRVAAGRTTLVIAHRLSTVVGADEIIVLQGGVIAERGRHAELLARRGLYAEMWNRQREAAEAEERLRAVTEHDEEGLVVRGAKAGEVAAAE